MIKPLLAGAVLALVPGAALAQGVPPTKPLIPQIAFNPRPGVERIKVHSKAIEGNLEGNTPDRDVFVILPKSYAAAKTKRYPVVYFLHGFAITAETFLELEKMPEAVRANEAAGGKEMIVVVPDSFTRMGGSMYSSSPTTGDFEAFVADDLVRYIDAHYRTVAAPPSRGLAGHSMGGYGTWKIAMDHPGVFSSIYAMSACCISPRTVGKDAAKYETMTVEQATKADFGTQALFASAAAWSPAPDKGPLFLDIGSKGGVADPLVEAEWAANSPLAMVPSHLSALRSYTAISTDVGNKDSLLGDDTAIHEALARFGVRHDWAVYDGNHVDHIAERFGSKVLPFFGKYLQ